MHYWIHFLCQKDRGYLHLSIYPSIIVGISLCEIDSLEEEAQQFYQSKTNGASKLARGVRAFDSLKIQKFGVVSFVISYSTGSFMKRFCSSVTFSCSVKGKGQKTILKNNKKLAGRYDGFVKVSISLFLRAL